MKLPSRAILWLIDNLLPWLIRHAAWLIARFSYEVKRSNDAIYRMVRGSGSRTLRDLGQCPLATSGEVVLGKPLTTKSKAQRRWVKGRWFGQAHLGTRTGPWGDCHWSVRLSNVRELRHRSVGRSSDLCYQSSQGWHSAKAFHAGSPSLILILKCTSLQRRWGSGVRQAY